jgi:hypothetical protein
MKSDDSLNEAQKEPVLDLADEWLGEAKFTAQVIAELDEALILFASKRTTLEEKMISSYFHKMAAGYAAILHKLHLQLCDRKEPLFNEAGLESLRTLNLRVREVVGYLVKALRFNFNFVEQYYEYDFYTRLSQNERFLEDQEVILKQIESCDV